MNTDVYKRQVTRSTVTDLLTMARFGKSENVCIDFTGAFIEDEKPDDIQADADRCV